MNFVGLAVSFGPEFDATIRGDTHPHREFSIEQEPSHGGDTTFFRRDLKPCPKVTKGLMPQQRAFDLSGKVVVAAAANESGRQNVPCVADGLRNDVLPS
jgi:hypothetical protein